MQSTKSIYKKPFEKITTYEECTWLGNDKPFFENNVCAVFRDKYPVTQGHLLFIAKQVTYYGPSRAQVEPSTPR